MPHAIAYFISPHGFGHAARAAAVMNALHGLQPDLRFEIFTLTPRWFFADSLRGPFGYHALLTDIGLVQTDSLTEDLEATLNKLDAFLPFPQIQLDTLARDLHRLHCRLVLCDISPLGIAAAHTAGIPAVLVENFTWDWIYEGYLSPPTADRLRPHITYLQAWFQQANYHIQTEPVCRPTPQSTLTTPPISRAIRTPAEQVRRRLGIPPDAEAVLITMGGAQWRYTFLEQLTRYTKACFIIPGLGDKPVWQNNLRLLPKDSGFYHPDLVNAVDAVVAKVGYSTLAEVYQADVPWGYIARPRFRESPTLVAYIERRMHGVAIGDAEFQTGDWLERLPELLAIPRRQRNIINGAEQVARFILQTLGSVTGAAPQQRGRKRGKQ